MTAAIDQAVIDAVSNMDRQNSFCCIAVVEGEKVVMRGMPIPRSNESDSLASQMDAIKMACMGGGVEAAFILVKTKSGAEEPVRMILFCSERSSPKVRMLIATTSKSLRDRCAEKGVKFADVASSQISKPMELKPSLFDEVRREAAMSESEKKNEEINAVIAEETKAAPQRVAMMTAMMPGAAMQLNDEACAALKALAEGNISAVVIAVEPPALVCKAQVDKGANAAAIVAAIPADVPRFVFAKWPGVDDKETFFIYVVPIKAAPKEKAPYVASKPGIIAQAEGAKCGGLKVTRRVELDDPAELEKKIKAAMDGHDASEGFKVEPEKKVTMVKGPRMLLG